MRRFACLALALLLTACSGPADPAGNAELQARLTALEARQEAAEKRHAADLAAVRQDLKQLALYLDTALNTLAEPGTGRDPTAGERLDKGLRQFRDKARELLEGLDRRLDQALEPADPQDPKGPKDPKAPDKTDPKGRQF